MHGAFDLDTIAGWCSGADYWGWRWTSSNAQLDFDSVDFVWQQQHRRSIVCSQQWCSGMCIAAVAPQQQQQYQPWIFANAIAWWLMAFGVTLIWINDILEHAYRLHSLLIYLSVLGSIINCYEWPYWGCSRCGWADFDTKLILIRAWGWPRAKSKLSAVCTLHCADSCEQTSHSVANANISIANDARLGFSFDQNIRSYHLLFLFCSNKTLRHNPT